MSVSARGLVAYVTLVALTVSGCGPTVRVALPANTQVPTHVALLPADYSVDIPRERINLVRSSLVSELRNHNFIVADDSVVATVCSSPQCPERGRLSSEYMVEGFITLSVNSFSKNSFLAGYYNQLTGTFAVATKEGKEIFSLDHTQSERGGLLFNSGQVFQGIISQVKNTGDAAYGDLAAKFSQTIVEQLPMPHVAETRASTEPMDIALTSVIAEWSGPATYTVCAQGTPHSFGSVLMGTQRTNLREVSPGRYCAAFSGLVAIPESTAAYVELKTAYGNSIRERLSLPALPPCNLDGRLQIASSEMALDCSTVGQDGSRREAGCNGKLSPCKLEKIVLFRSPSEDGLYKKVSEARRASLRIPQEGGEYEALAVGTGGVPSLAVPIPALSK